MTSSQLAFMLLVGHFLCDYPLQGDFLARGKNHRNPIPGFPWQHCLIAHALIHGGWVAWITGSATLGITETAAHALIDYGKCGEQYGINVDQILHISCKLFIWLAVLYV